MSSSFPLLNLQKYAPTHTLTQAMQTSLFSWFLVFLPYDTYRSLIPIKGLKNASQLIQVGHNMFSISTQVFKSNQWQLRSSLRQPMGGEAF
jgi:hypothetical protein